MNMDFYDDFARTEPPFFIVDDDEMNTGNDDDLFFNPSYQQQHGLFGHTAAPSEFVANFEGTYDPYPASLAHNGGVQEILFGGPTTDAAVPTHTEPLKHHPANDAGSFSAATFPSYDDPQTTPQSFISSSSSQYTQQSCSPAPYIKPEEAVELASNQEEYGDEEEEEADVTSTVDEDQHQHQHQQQAPPQPLAQFPTPQHTQPLQRFAVSGTQGKRNHTPIASSAIGRARRAGTYETAPKSQSERPPVDHFDQLTDHQLATIDFKILLELAKKANFTEERIVEVKARRRRLKNRLSARICSNKKREKCSELQETNRSLSDQVAVLSQENTELKTLNVSLSKDLNECHTEIDRLTKHIEYLTSVMVANGLVKQEVDVSMAA